jgi:hypothetical protein
MAVGDRVYQMSSVSFDYQPAVGEEYLVILAGGNGWELYMYNGTIQARITSSANTNAGGAGHSTPYDASVISGVVPLPKFFISNSNYLRLTRVGPTNGCFQAMRVV